MADPRTDTDHPAALVCPWCSAAVTPETAVCPSCNAILISDEEHDLPGVTSVDEAAVRAERLAPQRSRFLSWLAGETPDTPSTEVDPQAIARPGEDVQREILRLELEAQISNLQAEADSILSDALVEGRIADLPEGLRSLAAAEASAETPAETADAMVEAATGVGPTAEAAHTSASPAAPDTAETPETPETPGTGDPA